MPRIFETLFLIAKIQETIQVDLLRLSRRDDTNLIIFVSVLSGGIGYGMDVKARSLWFAR